jgi:uncharacterized protein YlxP (DUF503 family)
VSVGLLTLHIHLPGCSSLKEKRGRLKPLLNRLHKDFKVSAAEVAYQDVWQDAVIACALVSNDHKHTQRVMQKIANWVDTSWRDVDLVSEQIEIL